MQIKLTVPKEDVDAETLGAALEAATEIAQRQIEQEQVPPLAVAIDEGLRWGPEDTPPGEESFDPPIIAVARGIADCDDLGPYWAGELRASGEDPDARAIAYQSGPSRWHVVVQRGNGKIEDPSRWAGMGGGVSGQGVAERRYSRVPVTRPLGTPGRLVIGFARAPRGGVLARLDAPIAGTIGEGVSILRHGVDALDALDRTTRALALLALWGTPDDILARVAALAGALSGEPGDYEQHGGFISGLAGQLDLGKAADIATAFLDPLGISKLVAPLAQQFVQSYATGLAQRGSTPAASSSPAPSSRTTTAKGASNVSNGDDIPIERCPPGYHWENHGGVSICVPDGVEGHFVGATRGGGGRGAGGGRGGGGRGGGRGGGGRQQRQQQGGGGGGGGLEQDWQTGLFVDPDSGLLIDPFTGGLLSPDMAWNIDPESGVYTGPSSFAMGMGSPAGGAPPMPGMPTSPAAPGFPYGVPPGFTPQQYSYPQQGGYGGYSAPYQMTPYGINPYG